MPADDLCLPGCLDLVSARTWVVGAGHGLYTTTDAGRSWRASYSPLAFTYLQQPGFPTNLQLDFLSPRVGWAYEGDIGGDIGRPLGPPMAHDRWREELVDIFFGRPLTYSHRTGDSWDLC